MTQFLITMWFISVIAFVVYWRKKVNAKKQINQFPEKYEKVAKTKRIIGIVAIAFFVLGCINSEYEKSQKPQPDPVQEQATQQKPPADPEQVKKDVQAFYIQFCAVDKEIKDMWNTTWVPTIAALNNGVFSRYDGYEIMKKVEQYYAGQALHMDERLVIADSITGDTREKLEKVVQEYSFSMSAREDAADKMVDLLDEGNIKPSELEDVQHYINMANQSDATAAAGLAEMMQTLGIEIPQAPAE